MIRPTRCVRPGLLLALALLLLSGPVPAADEDVGSPRVAKGTLGKIERLDPQFDKLVPRGAVIEKLAEGFKWTEGPVWIPKGGYLLFSDIPRNSIFKWQEGKGVSLFMKPSGYTGLTPRGGEPGSNGLILDPQGRLVLMEHGDRRVSRVEKDGKKITLADRYMGKRLNSPNDGVFKSNGDLYFTDPPYGLLGLNKDPQKELPFNGVFRLSRDGKLTLLTKDMTFPNGIAFSPDEKTLYVSNSDPEKAVWMAFPVKEDGTLGKGRVFFDSTKWAKTRPGLPDGMKVDKAGNLFATGPGGLLVLTPEGKYLGRLNTEDRTSNCNWGNDGSVLYITRNHVLCRIKLNTKGKGF